MVYSSADVLTDAQSNLYRDSKSSQTQGRTVSEQGPVVRRANTRRFSRRLDTLSILTNLALRSGSGIHSRQHRGSRNPWDHGMDWLDNANTTTSSPSRSGNGNLEQPSVYDLRVYFDRHKVRREALAATPLQS